MADNIDKQREDLDSDAFPIGEDGPVEDAPPAKRKPVSDSEAPYDSILGSAAEPVNAGRGIIPTDHKVHEEDERIPDPDITMRQEPDDSILNDLAEDPSAIIDLEREQNSIRLMPDSMVANRFKILKELGAGGMGAVYLVEDIKLQEKRALKVMLPRLVADTVAQQRFLTEIKVLQRLAHESIVRVHDLGVDEDKGLQFFTMEHLQGVTLHKYLHQQGRSLPPMEVIDLAQKLCRALMYAHGKTIHRDLKPANVMLDENMNVTILDFGLAKLMTNAHLQMSNMVMGTFHYQSPEQRYDPTKVDRRTDLFSLGVMIYEMLTGEIPSGNFEPPSKVLKGIPKKLDRIVMRCLQNKPERRYQSAGELYDDLESAKHGAFALPWVGRRSMPRPEESVPPSTPGSMTPQPYVRPRQGFPVGILLALLIVIAVGGGLWFTFNGIERPTVDPPVVAIDTIHNEAKSLQERVLGNEEALSTYHRYDGDEFLENGETALQAGNTEEARSNFEKAVVSYNEALAAAGALSQIEDARAEIHASFGRIEGFEYASEDDATLANRLLQTAKTLEPEVDRLLHSREPDPVRALERLNTIRRMLGNIEAMHTMLPLKTEAAAVQASARDLVYESHRKDPNVFQEIREEFDRAQSEINRAADLEVKQLFSEALETYQGFIQFAEEVPERVASVAAQQKDEIAGRRAQAEAILAEYSPSDLNEFDLDGRLQEIQNAMATADATAGTGAFTVAKQQMQKAIDLGTELDKEFDIRLAARQDLGNRLADARDSLSTIEERMAGVDLAASDASKSLYQEYEDLKAAAAAAEADGNIEEAEKSYKLAVRQLENAAAASDQDRVAKLLEESELRAVELESSFASLNWENDLPEAITQANEKIQLAKATATDNPLEARQLYDDAGDLLEQGIQSIRFEIKRVQEEGLERIRVARRDVESLEQTLPPVVVEFAEDELGQIKLAKAEAAKAEEEGRIEDSIAILAKAKEELSDVRELGLTRALDAVREGALEAQEIALASAQSADQIAETAAAVHADRKAQGDPHRDTGRERIELAKALLEDTSGKEGLERYNELQRAAQTFREADNSFKLAIKRYDEKSEAEILNDRLKGLESDFATRRTRVAKLESPYNRVQTLLTEAETAVKSNKSVKAYEDATAKLNQAERLHGELNTQQQTALAEQRNAQEALAGYRNLGAPGNAAGQTQFASADQAFAEATALTGQERFADATASFKTAANLASEALSAFNEEKARLAAAQTPPPVDPPPVVAADSPPNISGAPNVQTAKTAAETAMNNIQNDPQFSRYSRIDFLKAKKEIESAEKASNPADKIRLYNNAKEKFEMMQPSVSSTGGR